MLSTCPCLTPLEFDLPKPKISSLPHSFLRPAITAILVVPMSSPTIIGCSLFMFYSCLVVITDQRISIEFARIRKTLFLFNQSFFYGTRIIMMVLISADHDDHENLCSIVFSLQLLVFRGWIAQYF